MIISTTSPTPEGEMLWVVQFSGSWYDNDARGSGQVSCGTTAYVLAKSMAEAKKKAEPAFVQSRKDAEGEVSVEASIVTIESLVPIAKIGGWGNPPKQVKLLPEDAKRYRIGVCLIPVEEDEND